MGSSPAPKVPPILRHEVMDGTTQIQCRVDRGDSVSVRETFHLDSLPVSKPRGHIGPIPCGSVVAKVCNWSRKVACSALAMDELGHALGRSMCPSCNLTLRHERFRLEANGSKTRHCLLDPGKSRHHSTQQARTLAVELGERYPVLDTKSSVAATSFIQGVQYPVVIKVGTFQPEGKIVGFRGG
jgi:hypothetical protein